MMTAGMATTAPTNTRISHSVNICKSPNNKYLRGVLALFIQVD